MPRNFGLPANRWLTFWHAWFAWYPVRTRHRKWRWLRVVYRRWVEDPWDYQYDHFEYSD